MEFKDIFAWIYKELRGVRSHIVEHIIKLDTSMPPTHKAHYCMNPNYVAIVKHHLDKLLVAGDTKPIKEATLLSPTIIVPKNDGKSQICVGFWKLNATTKLDPHPLPFTYQVLD